MTTAKAAEVKKLVDNFFRDRDLLRNIVSAICSDGAPVMLTKFRFWCATKSRCTTHNCNALSFAQACLGNKLAEVLKIVVDYETPHIQGAV